MTIRVLFPFSGHIVGGSHISALTLIRHLPVDIEPIIGIFSKGALTNHLDSSGIPWIKLPDLDISTEPLGLMQEFRQLISSALPLRRFLKSQRINIVHTHEYNMHCLWALAKTGTSTKQIWHQRSMNNSRRLALYVPFINYYLTISQFCRDNLTAPVRHRAEVLPNPVDIPVADLEEKPDLRVVTGENPDALFKIGFVGHLDQQKRIHTFIEIARHLHLEPRYKHLRFFVFGNDKTDAIQNIRELISKYNLGNCFFLMGSRFPISPWIRELDLLVATAANEGLGRALIEAQMLGVPVLASEHGGHKELISDKKTGYFAKLDDAEDFVEKIKALMNDLSATRQVVDRAKTEAENKFSVKAHVDRVIQIYRSLMID